MRVPSGRVRLRRLNDGYLLGSYVDPHVNPSSAGLHGIDAVALRDGQVALRYPVERSPELAWAELEIYPFTRNVPACRSSR